MLLLLIFSIPQANAKGFTPVPVWSVLGNTISYDSGFPSETQLWPDDISPQGEGVQPITYNQMVKENLPIDSGLTNKKFAKYQSASAANFITPICVVGYDQLSLRWLQENSQLLSQAGAVCMLAKAERTEQIVAIQKAAKDVTIQPVSARSLAEQVGLKYYPALIYNGWVAQ